MSTEISVHWRSFGNGGSGAGGGGDGNGGNNNNNNNNNTINTSNEPLTKSPSVSSLPPLPDLIPIRKSTPIKSILRDVNTIQSSQPQSQNSINHSNLDDEDGSSTFVSSMAAALPQDSTDTTQLPLPDASAAVIITVGTAESPPPSTSPDIVDIWPQQQTSSEVVTHSPVGESVQCDDDDPNNIDTEIEADNEHKSCIKYELDSKTTDQNSAQSTETHNIPASPNASRSSSNARESCQINDKAAENYLSQLEHHQMQKQQQPETQQKQQQHPKVAVPEKESIGLSLRCRSVRANSRLFTYCEKQLHLARFTISTTNRRKKTTASHRRYKKPTQFWRTKNRKFSSPCYDADGNAIPRVNPIFLFVKQDDTKIVEVRCEDYDKRNRIRLTKTVNGWRAIPRTDSSSSIVASLLPKVIVTKKERDDADEANYANRIIENDETEATEKTTTKAKWHIPTSIDPDALAREEKSDVKTLLADNNEEHTRSHKKKKKKKKKKRKKERDCDKEREKEEECNDGGIVKTKQADDTAEPIGIENTSRTSPHPIDAHNVSPRHHTAMMVEDSAPTQPSTIQPPQPSPSSVLDSNLLLATNVLKFEENNKCATMEKLSSSMHFPSVENATNEEEMHCEESDGTISKGKMEIAVDETTIEDLDTEAKNNSLGPDETTDADAVVFETTYNSKSVCLSDPSAEIQIVPDDDEDDGVVDDVDNDDDHQFVSDAVVCESSHHQLSDEYHDLIEGIPNIQSAHTEDILDHCENTMTGAELLDSLVERGCEDNHISGEDDIKHTICLTDDYNDDDDVLLETQPVADIISRLGDSLGSSPKCLSFNEVGEIEGLHDSLFETSQTDLNAENLVGNLTPFNRSALEELTMTLKDLEKRSDDHHEKQLVESTIVSPDSCQEELPKDLSFKKNNEVLQIIRHSSPRPISRDSDAIQSPQPSGLPAVPPSPDIILNQLNKHHTKPLFLDLTSPSPKSLDQRNQEKSIIIDLISPLSKQPQPRIQQKEPLDLGKHRKSASPTVSCSEEAKRTQHSSDLESLPKRIKSEHPDKSLHHSSNDLLDQQSKTSQLADLLASGKDPDPLTQLRLLIRNPEWKLPDPILVPKDRLNAVLASPAREIPLLLTTRPELRLPEAFAFPAILQDPDILVISFAQLEAILQKQDDMLKASKSATKLDKKQTDKSMESPRIREKAHVKTPATPTTPIGPLLANGMAGDIDAATMAAFNQMLWLPYLGQMGQMNPDLFKAMSGFANAGPLQDPLQFANPNNRFPNFPAHTTPMGYGNPLDFAMWQDALNQANSANMQRVMKLNAERESQKKSMEMKPHMVHQSRQMHQNQPYMQQPQQQHSQKINHMLNSINQMGMPPFFQSSLGNMANLANANRFYGTAQRTQQQQMMNNVSQFGSAGYRQNAQQMHGNTEHSRSSNACAQSSNKQSHSMNHSMASPPNPFFPPSMSNFQDFGNRGGKSRKDFAAAMQQHHQSNHSMDSSSKQPRVTCKSLTNLLQPDLIQDPFKQTDNSAKMSNLMAMPTFDLTSPPVSTTTTTPPVQPKLKVKPGLHLLDPLARQRRLFNADDVSEVGSTTNGMDDIMSPNSTGMYHPLLK